MGKQADKGLNVPFDSEYSCLGDTERKASKASSGKTLHDFKITQKDTLGRYDVEMDGEKLNGVTAARIDLDAYSLPQVTLTLLVQNLSVELMDGSVQTIYKNGHENWFD